MLELMFVHHFLWIGKIYHSIYRLELVIIVIWSTGHGTAYVRDYSDHLSCLHNLLSQFSQINAHNISLGGWKIDLEQCLDSTLDQNFMWIGVTNEQIWLPSFIIWNNTVKPVFKRHIFIPQKVSPDQRVSSHQGVPWTQVLLCPKTHLVDIHYNIAQWCLKICKIVQFVNCIPGENNYCDRNTTYPLYITSFHCYMTYNIFTYSLLYDL